MRIEVRQILSLKLHEASCHLLIMGDVYVLLDCGISSSFDFSLYRNQQANIKKVSVVLITHPSIEYLGALPFILTQFKISPKIFTTKPISQLGPLNIHQALLYLRNPKYTPQIYEKICTIFEDSVVKPLQKKVFRINSDADNNKKQQSADSIHLVCYNVGNTIGSVCWRISYFMFNCLYLVGYNNYSQYHLSGMDIEAIVSERTDLIITDCYDEQKEEKEKMPRKDIVKKEVEQKCHLARLEGKEKIIFACYENERIVELACILVLLNKEKKIEGKVDFVHSESLYLQSVRIYPELEFKLNEEDETLFNNRYLTEKRLQNRFLLTTAKIIEPQGMIWPELCQFDKNKTTIIYFGHCNPVMNSCLDDLRQLFEIQKPQQPERTVMQTENVTEPQTETKFQQIKQIRSDPYIYNNGTFPKFQLQKQHMRQFDAFGEHYQQAQQLFVQEEEIKEEKPLELEKKKSNFEDRKRIFFEMPETNNTNKLLCSEGVIKFNGSITNFESSIHLLSRVKAQKNLFINCDNREFTKYEIKFRSFDKRMEIFGIHKRPVFWFQKPYEVIDLPVKVYQEADGTLVLPESGMQAVKVNGELVQVGNQLQIRLQRSDEKELKEFNLAKFYKSLKGIENTRFTDKGTVQIGGITMSLKKGEISIEGMYSNQYYKLRQMLYEYMESA